MCVVEHVCVYVSVEGVRVACGLFGSQSNIRFPFRCVSLRFVALRCFAWRCVALRCVAFCSVPRFFFYPFHLPLFHAQDVHVHNFDLIMHGKALLSEANLRLVHGRRYGIVGRNGCGKTTMLKAIAHHDIEGFPRGLRVLHVAQEVVGDDTPVLQAVLQSDSRIQQLVEREAELLAMMDGKGSGAAPAGGDTSTDGATTSTAPAAAVVAAPAAAAVAATVDASADASAPAGDEDATATTATATATAPTAAAPAGSGDAAKPSMTATEEAQCAAELAKVYERMDELDAHSADSRASELLAGLGFTPIMQVRLVCVVLWLHCARCTCMAWWCVVLSCLVLYCVMLCCVVLCCVVLCCAVLCCVVLCCVVLCCAVLCLCRVCVVLCLCCVVFVLCLCCVCVVLCCVVLCFVMDEGLVCLMVPCLCCLTPVLVLCPLRNHTLLSSSPPPLLLSSTERAHQLTQWWMAHACGTGVRVVPEARHPAAG